MKFWNIKLIAIFSTQRKKARPVNYLPVLLFSFAVVLLLELEFFDFEAEPADFDLFSLPTPATFAPVSIAPANAPTAAPLITSVRTSVALSRIPVADLFIFFWSKLPSQPLPIFLPEPSLL